MNQLEFPEIERTRAVSDEADTALLAAVADEAKELALRAASARREEREAADTAIRLQHATLAQAVANLVEMKDALRWTASMIRVMADKHGKGELNTTWLALLADDIKRTLGSETVAKGSTASAPPTEPPASEAPIARPAQEIYTLSMMVTRLLVIVENLDAVYDLEQRALGLAVLGSRPRIACMALLSAARRALQAKGVHP